MVFLGEGDEVIEVSIILCMWSMCIYLLSLPQRVDVMKMSEDDINALLNSKGFFKKTADPPSDDNSPNEHQDL